MLLRRCCPGDVFPKLVSWTEFGCRARLGQAARTDTAAMLGEWFNNLESRVGIGTSAGPSSTLDRARTHQVDDSSLCPRSGFSFGSRAV